MEAVIYRMADAPLTYGIVIGVFIGLGVILFAARAKRHSSQKESQVDTSSGEHKLSPA
jgi:hypothetical protein